jgi:hypothetical protein
VSDHDENQTLDADIHRAVWLSKQDIMANETRCRSPLVLACLNDYLAQQRYPLTLLHN